MKKIAILLLLMLVAASYVDDTDAEFQQGTTTATNATSDQIELAINNATTYATSGNYISRELDLGSNPTTTISWNSVLPTGTTLLVNTRAGNSSSYGAGWSSWSGNYATSAGSVVTSPTSRYLQYRLQLSTSNQSVTPVVTSVSIIYTENGPIISSQSQVNLTEDTTGTYRFRANVQDTLNFTNVSSRYRIGTSSSYSSWQNMSADATSYYTDITEPLGGWDTVLSEVVQLQVYAQNNNSDNLTYTLNETVDNVNEAPVLASLSNITGTEGTTLTRSISGSDPDGDNVTFSTTHGSITKVSNSLAQLTWNPADNETGLVNVTITMSDGTLQDTETFTANITETNKAPTIDDITDVSGYYGEIIDFTVTATENDTSDNLTWIVQPSIFQLEEFVNGTNGTAARTARARFYALDDHKGNITYNITVRDAAGLEDTTNVTISIRHCGDNVCQEQENVTSCKRDCEGEEAKPVYLAIQAPRRICINETAQLTTYNASERYTCYRDGLTENYKAICDELGGVSIELFRLDGIQRSSPQTLTSNSDGIATWTPTIASEYKLVATEEGYISASRILTAQACNQDVETDDGIITTPKPNVEVAEQRPEVTPLPDLQQPGDVQETSIVAAFIFYVFVPLILAILIYTCSVYYDINKEADPNILKARMKYWEIRNKLSPRLQKIYAPVKPYLDPVVRIWKENIVEPVAEMLRPIAKKLSKIGRKK